MLIPKKESGGLQVLSAAQRSAGGKKSPKRWKEKEFCKGQSALEGYI